jgi:hypothetical protein
MQTTMVAVAFLVFILREAEDLLCLLMLSLLLLVGMSVGLQSGCENPVLEGHGFSHTL